MKNNVYNSDLDGIIGGCGLMVDARDAFEDGYTVEEIIDEYQTVVGAIKLLLVSGNLDENKLTQATSIARGLRE